MTQLYKKFDKLNIKESDLTESFVKGSGKGGQKVNKTASAVKLKVVKDSVEFEVSCQKERSQILNRYYARKLLVEKLMNHFFPEESQAMKKLLKIKKQKQRRKRKAKKKESE